MKYVERYHEKIRRAYMIIVRKAPDFDKVAALQLAVKTVNESLGPNGLVPTSLEYEFFPRLEITTERPSATM